MLLPISLRWTWSKFCTWHIIQNRQSALLDVLLWALWILIAALFFFVFFSLSFISCFRGPAAIWLPQHRHGSPAEGGGAHKDGHYAVRRQRHPRPGDLLVQGLPARGPQQQPGSHQTAPIRWDKMAFCLFVCLFCFFVRWFLIWEKLNKDTEHSEA